MPPFQPGRFAALDVGSHSVLLLVADIDEEGHLTPVVDGGRHTRLSEQCFGDRRLTRPARERTLEAIADLLRMARRAGAEAVAAVGTSVLREAENGAEFLTQVRRETGVRIEVISGRQEAELAYRGNMLDHALPAVEGERLVLDVGGGSTELTRGLGESILETRSLPLGAVRLTEMFLKSDPPRASELRDAETCIEAGLAELQPPPPCSVLIGCGGTLVTLASVARAGGFIGCDAIHGAVLTHARISELVDLFRTLPIEFRRRVPGLDAGRADVILAGAMILHQAMGALGLPQLTVSTSGVRHGTLYTLARQAVLKP